MMRILHVMRSKPAATIAGDDVVITVAVNVMTSWRGGKFVRKMGALNGKNWLYRSFETMTSIREPMLNKEQKMMIFIEWSNMLEFWGNCQFCTAVCVYIGVLEIRFLKNILNGRKSIKTRLIKYETDGFIR